MKRLVKYFNKRSAAIDSILRKPPHKYTPEIFHELRVEIKKLNALFDLINFCAKDFKRKKSFEPFKLLFQQAGKIRALQVEEEMLHKYLADESPSNYRNNIIERRVKEEQHFFLMIENELTSTLKKTCHHIVPFIEKVNAEKANQYLEFEINSIKDIMSQIVLDPELVHRLRKRLKMLWYNVRSLFPGNSKQTSAKQDVLPDLLGKWHDCYLMTLHLEEATNDIPKAPGEINRLNRCKNSVETESEMLIQNIHRAMHDQALLLDRFTLPAI